MKPALTLCCIWKNNKAMYSMRQTFDFKLIQLNNVCCLFSFKRFKLRSNLCQLLQYKCIFSSVYIICLAFLPSYHQLLRTKIIHWFQRHCSISRHNAIIYWISTVVIIPMLLQNSCILEFMRGTQVWNVSTHDNEWAFWQIRFDFWNKTKQNEGFPHGRRNLGSQLYPLSPSLLFSSILRQRDNLLQMTPYCW